MDNYKQKPWYRLNVNVSGAIRDDFDWRSVINFDEGPISCYTVYKEQIYDEIFNKDWLEYWHSIGLTLNEAFLFWRHGEIMTGPAGDPPHFDTYFNEPFRIHHYGCNWTLDYKPFWDKWKGFVDGEDDDGVMTWYHMNGQDLSYNYKEEQGRGSTLLVPGLLDHQPVSTIDIGKNSPPTLVRTSLPHKVVSQQPRLLLTIRNLIPGAREDMLWEEIVDKLKHLIIE